LGQIYRRLTGALDRFQRRFRLTSVLFAVTKRYSDDRGGQLGALMTFYGFLSVFPLILLLLTFAGLLLPGTQLEKDIVNSALAQFPVIGDQLAANIHAITKGNSFAVVVSTLGLLWGAFGITSSMQFATHRIWREPPEAEPGLWPRTLKGIEILAVLTMIILASTLAAALSTVGAQYFGRHHGFLRLGAFGIALIINFAGYVLALWMLAPKEATIKVIMPGAILGATGWTIIQAFGGYLVGHRLQHASQIYGFFAVVFGLIFWISLGVQLFLYSSELNVVLHRREWPRYLFGEPEASATNSS